MFVSLWTLAVPTYGMHGIAVLPYHAMHQCLGRATAQSLQSPPPDPSTVAVLRVEADRGQAVSSTSRHNLYNSV